MDQKLDFKLKLKKYWRKNSIWVFVLPALIAFALVIVVPFFIGFYYSFTDWDATGREINWIGFTNYIEVFSLNPSFIYSIIITIIFSFINIILINTVSFSLALLVTRKLRFKNVYRLGFFLPNLIGGLILGYIWQFIFNNALPSLGESIGSTGLGDLLMLSERNTAVLAISIAWAWQYAGYIMMIYVTAIQNIPKDLIEAAQIDGASSFQRLRNITLPMVAPAFTVTLFLTLINSFKQFDVNYSLTQGGPVTRFMGSSIWGTKLIPMQIYDTYAEALRPALAQSMAIIFFILLTIVSVAQVRYSKSKEVEI